MARAFGADAVLTTAFGLEGCVLIDMIGRLGLPIRLATIDTGLFFGATYDTWRRLEARHGRRIEAIRPLSIEAQAELHGPELWARAPDQCCALRKVAPLQEALRGARAWITGVRRDQTPERAAAPKVARDRRFGVVKLNPLADWSEAQVRAYLSAHDVPYNPMFDDGYPSIGCAPCTDRVAPGEDPRAGRWRGTEKRECGLHWDTSGRLVRLPGQPEVRS